MADTAQSSQDMASGNDMKAHAKDYGKFTAMFKWGAILTFIITAIVVLLIAS